MDSTVKILIIIVIILVGALGLASGFILQGQFMNKNSTINQSNTTVNNTNNNTTQNNIESDDKQSEFISEGEAIDIARANVKADYTEAVYADTIFYYDKGDERAHWTIFLKGKTSDKLYGGAIIDARTGTITHTF